MTLKFRKITSVLIISQYVDIQMKILLPWGVLANFAESVVARQLSFTMGSGCLIAPGSLGSSAEIISSGSQPLILPKCQSSSYCNDSLAFVV